MSVWELFCRNPEEALEFVLQRAENSYTKAAHILVLHQQKGSSSRGGSYKFITRQMLEGRTYEIEYIDDWVAIYFTDAVYDPVHHKVEMK